MTTKLDLINPADRLTAMERVTAEGLLSLSKETVRGNEYYVFGEAPKNLREYYESVSYTHLTLPTKNEV